MASHVRHLPPIDAPTVVSRSPVSDDAAVAILRRFVSTEATSLNVPNETVFQLKQVLAGLTGEATGGAGGQPDDGESQQEE